MNLFLVVKFSKLMGIIINKASNCKNKIFPWLRDFFMISITQLPPNWKKKNLFLSFSTILFCCLLVFCEIVHLSVYVMQNGDILIEITCLLMLFHFEPNRRWYNLQSNWSWWLFSICYKMSYMQFWHRSFCTAWPFGRSDMRLIYYGMISCIL